MFNMRTSGMKANIKRTIGGIANIIGEFLDIDCMKCLIGLRGGHIPFFAIGLMGYAQIKVSAKIKAGVCKKFF